MFDLRFTWAVMNSAVARHFLRRDRRSNTDLYPDDWKKLPIPVGTPAGQATLAAHVDRILAAKRAGDEASVPPLEREIDAHVFRLYGLTPEEIAIVEGATK